MAPRVAEQKDTDLSSPASQEVRFFHAVDEADMDVAILAGEPIPERSRLVRIASHEWAVALVYLFLDVVAWVAIYGTLSFLRREAFHTTPFEFFFLEVIQLVDDRAGALHHRRLRS